MALRPAYEPDLFARAEVNAEGKRRIAQACMAEVKDGDAIFLDSGTTMISLAEALRPEPAPLTGAAAKGAPVNVNVLTNCLGVARVVAPLGTVRHTVLGGQYRAAGDCFVGALAVNALQQFTLNIAFIGVTGLAEPGFTVSDVNEAQVKTAAMERARRVIVPMDHTKVGATDFVKVCDPDRIDVLVTDEYNEHLAQMCQEHGTRLVVAGPTGRA